MSTEMEEQRIRDMFDEIYDLLDDYAEYDFEFAAENKDDVLVQLRPQGDAFNILLVLLGKKKAMTFYGYENQSERQDPEDDKEIVRVTNQMGDHLRDMINDTFGL